LATETPSSQRKRGRIGGSMRKHRSTLNDRRGSICLAMDLAKLWGAVGQVGWQGDAGRRGYEVQVHLGREGVGNPAEPRDRGIGGRIGPMQGQSDRQINAQSDGCGGEDVAAEHPAAVPDDIAAQNEIYSEPGGQNPAGAESEKSCRSDAAGLRMRRDP